MQAIRRVALCSASPAKVAATKTVCEKLFPSASLTLVELKGLPDQPVGHSETKDCAITRAKHAVAISGSDFGVGLEGGVSTDGWLINCVAVVSKDGKESHSWGLSFKLPEEAARRILINKEEMSPVMDSLFDVEGVSKSHGGAIGVLTNGHVSRADTYVSPLICAFIPFLHPKLYSSAI
jgi:inosine/xanthosine triphosphatase